MELNGIDFGNVLGASGVQGNFGEGYALHKLWGPFGPDLRDLCLVAKTTTLFGRAGNMPLTRNYTPREFIPSCVKAQLLEERMINAVSLSGPGLGALLGLGIWQKLAKPFFLSIMAVGETKEKRLEEMRIMVDMIGLCKDDFRAKFGMQVNLSCGNTGHKPAELISESNQHLRIASKLDVPLVPKYSIASAPIEAMMELNDNPDCAAVCASNAIRWDDLDGFGERVWGRKTSPLAHMGKGAISGKDLRPLVCNWIKRLRDAGFTKHINGGGGIFRPADVVQYHQAGASSIFVGTVVSFASLFPFWYSIRAIVAQANALKWK